jgi:hypothetical protein
MALPIVTTATDIANLALSELGARQLTDIEMDTTEEAKACRQHFTRVRDGLLREHQWNFALTRAELSATTDPPTEWGTAWTLPSTCVRFIRIVTEDPVNPVRDFALEGRLLLVNGVDKVTEKINIVYISNAVAISAWDSLFIDAMVFALAAKIANRVAQNPAMATDMVSKFKSLALPAATNADAREVASGENSGVHWLVSQSQLVNARRATR